MSSEQSSDPGPYVRGCAFQGVSGLPYPRALPADVGRLPADTWATACVPVGVRLEIIGEAEAVELRYETATGDAGVRGKAAGTAFEAWRGEQCLGSQPAQVGRGVVRLPMGRGPELQPTVVYLPEGMRPEILELAGIGGPIRPAPGAPRWLCYGDSIVEGWSSSGPAHAWPAVVGRRLGLDTVNLGYAGAARGEAVSAEEMADLPAEVITVAYGTNCWTRIPHSLPQISANLAAFLDLVRSGHPHTPIVVVSPVLRPDAESTPNRLGATLAGIRSTMEKLVAERMAHDRHLFVVQGAGVLSPPDLVDGIHPGDRGHLALAQAVAPALQEALALPG